MSDEAALLRAIYAEPDEDTPRLVYADWLDENGQPERAEFIRAQVRLAAREGDRRLSEREHELREAHEKTWLDQLGPFDHKKTLVEYHRGFVDTLVMYDGTPSDLEIIRRIPSLRRIELSRCSLTPTVLRAIATMPALERLQIYGAPFEVEWFDLLDPLPCWTVVRIQDSEERNPLFAGAFKAFQDCRISRVTTLAPEDRRCAAIRFVRTFEREYEVEAFRPNRPVREVGFQQWDITDTEVQLLSHLTELESVYLFQAAVTTAGLEHVAKLQHLQAVELSQVYVNSITPLTRCLSLNLLELWSYENIGDKGTEGLEQLTNLQYLKLFSVEDDEPFRDATLLRIAKLQELRTLEIRPVTPEDVRSFRVLLNLPKLESLTLNDSEYTGAELQRFLDSLRQQ